MNKKYDVAYPLNIKIIPYYIIEILLNHVVNGAVPSGALQNGQTVTTLGGGTLQVGIDSSKNTVS